MNYRTNVLRLNINLQFAIALACSLVGSIASPLAPCPIPLEKGIEWTYEGKVEWPQANSAVANSTNVQWVTKVISAVKRKQIRAYVVSGMPDELAWFQPRQTPGFSVLLQSSNRVYRIPVNTEEDGKILSRRLVMNRSVLPTTAEEWLVLPLVRGERWGRAADRNDNDYCWYVEDQTPENLKNKPFATSPYFKTWTLAYRTNPDHQIMEIVEGVGITHYSYAHHGTISSADLHLVSITRPHANR